VIIIAGSRERDSGVVQVKDTKNRIQKEVSLAELPDAVKMILT
jgi:histidyl-tRNA synthetase